jgi:hypothetical protein
LTNDQIIATYKNAYSGSPNGGLVVAADVTPGQAFEKLVEWAGL